MKYTKFLLDSFYNPVGCGTISGAHVASKLEDKDTGDAIKFFFLLDEDKIKEVKYQACGSVVMFASLSAVTRLITDKTISEALSINEKQVIKEIKQVNRCDYSTISFVIEALNKALGQAIKKLGKGVTNTTKEAKVKSLLTSKNINIYSSDNEEIVVLKPIEQIKPKVKETRHSLIVVKQEEDIPAVEEVEITAQKPPVITKKEVIESVPTKIEVRVVEEEEDASLTKLEETKSEEASNIVSEGENTLNKEVPSEPSEFILNENKRKKHPLFDHSSASEDNMIDEIDSITAKLTDAITKLNFKFDVDEDD